MYAIFALGMCVSYEQRTLYTSATSDRLGVNQPKMSELSMISKGN